MDLLYRSASARPDGLALVYREERVTHAQLVDRVERLAAGLAAEGIGPGDSVALLLPNDLDFVAGYHAIAALGAAVVPINPAFKRDELEFCFRTCGVRMVIADELGAAGAEGLGPRIVPAGELPALMDGEPARLAPRPGDEPLVYLFSSGSTGRPKRVPRTHAQVCAEAGFYPDVGIGPDDKIFNTVPLFHSYGMGFCLLAAAGTGAALVMLEDPNPFVMRRARAMELIEQERATVLPGVPFTYKLMAEAPESADLSSLRLCLSAGTAMQRPVFDAFMDKFGVAVRQHYGCTEAGSLTANLDPDPAATFETVGPPLGPVEIQIVDGEVAVRSPARTSGYSDMPELNRQVFREDGFFLTGDLGRLDDGGRLTITGRKKLLIEVGGYKVDPIEVEDVVAAHPEVGEAVVVGVDAAGSDDQVVKAVVVPTGEVDERELIGFCRARLANYKVPQLVELREEIPRSPIGKILRKYLV